MNDGIIKGTGNSRYLKGTGWPATYAEFKSMAEAGTLPFDLNGINEAGWQQLATLLSKANLLSDTTAGKLDSVTTVDAALNLLARMNHGLANEYVWEKSTFSHQYVILEPSANTAIPSIDSVSESDTYGAGLAVDQSTGVLSITGIFTPTESFSYSNLSYWNSLLPFYFKSSGNSTIYKCRNIQNVSGSGNFNGCIVTAQLTSVKTIHGYVNDPVSDAYPPAVSDVYTYTALGKIGASM